MEKKEDYKVSKSDCIDILDRTLGFVRNCDSKASAILAIYGVIFTIILTTDSPKMFISKICFVFAMKSFGNILFIVLLVITVLINFSGLIQIFLVLNVKVKVEQKKELDNESKIFFEDIQKKNYVEYKERLLKMSEEDFLDDIISQIYKNSKICSKKYKRYKIGFILSSIGFLAFSFLWIIGILIY